MKVRHRSRSRSQLRRCPPLPAPISSRLLLRWGTRFAHFRLLSNNVLREISSYYGFSPAPVTVHQENVYLLDMKKKPWKPLMQSRLQDRLFFPTNAAVNVSPSQVFLCGAGKNWTSGTSKRTLLIDDTSIVPLAEMNHRRAGHWAIYDEMTVSVYVFGGSNEKYQLLHSAEVYEFIPGKWKELPNMCQANIVVPPCQHGRIIYLAVNSVIETFGLLSHTFAVTNIQLPTPMNLAYIVIHEGLLCGTGSLDYYKWELTTGQLVAQVNQSYYLHHVCVRAISSIVRGSLAYVFLSDRGYDCINLNSGNKEGSCQIRFGKVANN